MKKVSKIFYFLLGLGIFSGIGVYAATTLLSKNVTFTSQDENWQVSNVKEAIDDLYEKTDNVSLPDSFAFTWCCHDVYSTTTIVDKNSWPYVTFSNVSGNASYDLVFQDASANTLANITLDQKYEISSMPSTKVYLSCHTSGTFKCLNVNYSN